MAEADELFQPNSVLPAAQCTEQRCFLHVNGCEVERFALSLNFGTL